MRQVGAGAGGRRQVVFVVTSFFLLFVSSVSDRSFRKRGNFIEKTRTTTTHESRASPLFQKDIYLIKSILGTSQNKVRTRKAG